MGQLQIRDLEELIENLKKKYPNDYKNITIYIGDDEELNGVHSANWCEEINENDETDEDIIEMINDNAGDIKFNKKAVLIS